MERKFDRMAVTPVVSSGEGSSWREVRTSCAEVTKTGAKPLASKMPGGSCSRYSSAPDIIIFIYISATS
ncbi:hypothetical protein WN51_04609 [Melipona quadrifasciata]|uniref:Uncharacterized protein n=1 Tax=Melipona quadrifasciata TaxID=166423 RepID=A0A0N0BD87_9HYME|nr:hypothetical protein WN51_04609 [Melipona quadrifasciata]